jgi:hypothetical protein
MRKAREERGERRGERREERGERREERRVSGRRDLQEVHDRGDHKQAQVQIEEQRRAIQERATQERATQEHAAQEQWRAAQG